VRDADGRIHYNGKSTPPTRLNTPMLSVVVDRGFGARSGCWFLVSVSFRSLSATRLTR
jgi:hypothetical protein